MPDVPSESSMLCAVTLRTLMGCGILREVVICAGARNCALVAALASAPGIRVWHHFEERSAAFFALGRLLSHERPVAVITTSGTAVAELLPAIIEAHYQGLPLVALTADRPAVYRGTGAPQAIEQAGIFGNYPTLSLDVRELDDLTVIEKWNRNGPLHVNLCLEEPGAEQLDWLRHYGAGLVPRKDEDDPPSPAPRACSLPARSDFPDPLVLVGDLLRSEIPAAVHFLSRLGAPIYAEAASGLREEPRLRPWLLSGGDAVLRTIPHRSVIRLGGVPACRFWRDLEDRPSIPVISLTRSGHRGLARECTAFPVHPLPDWSGDLPDKNRGNPVLPESQAALEACLQRHSASEPALVRALSSLIPPESVVFTGNSMPIREWNLCALPDHPCHARALRGANGIDGNLSAFLGLAADFEGEAWCLIGDLTALYDLAAPWILPQFSHTPKLRIVVIQNAGGKIFSRLPALRSLTDYERRLMENPHRIPLKGWAEQWGLDYHAHHGALTELPPLPDRLVLELHPDPGATEAFWANWATASRPQPNP